MIVFELEIKENSKKALREQRKEKMYKKLASKRINIWKRAIWCQLVMLNNHSNFHQDFHFISSLLKTKIYDSLVKFRVQTIRKIHQACQCLLPIILCICIHSQIRWWKMLLPLLMLECPTADICLLLRTWWWTRLLISTTVCHHLICDLKTIVKINQNQNRKQGHNSHHTLLSTTIGILTWWWDHKTNKTIEIRSKCHRCHLQCSLDNPYSSQDNQEKEVWQAIWQIWVCICLTRLILECTWVTSSSICSRRRASNEIEGAKMIEVEQDSQEHFRNNIFIICYLYINDVVQFVQLYSYII